MCALPKPSRPEYSTTIPSTGKKIKYQPFTVKEEKVLVLAAESENLDEISNAISNVLSSCVTSPVDFDPEKLALFDIEYLFLKARAKSVGESLKLLVTDPNDASYTVEHEVNIDTIKVKRFEGHETLVKLDENTAIQMKYPGLSFFSEGVKIDTLADSSNTVARCVSSLVIDEEVYAAADLTREELVEWLDALTADQYAKLMEFFTTMPRLSHTIKLKNKKSGENFEILLEGLADFF